MKRDERMTDMYYVYQDAGCIRKKLQGCAPPGLGRIEKSLRLSFYVGRRPSQKGVEYHEEICGDRFAPRAAGTITLNG